MIRQCGFKRFNGNVRELYKLPLRKNNLMAIPRDLGEIPRNYVLKLLLLHQPIRLLDFWEVCKQQDDVPLDSAKHLRLVLKIAALQKWVYAEKNQSNNLYYYYIHQGRAQEVQALLRADELARRAAEADAEGQRIREEQEAVQREESTLEDNIVMMQNLLVSNTARLRLFDPAYVDSLPFVNDDGVIDCTWHVKDSREGVNGRQGGEGVPNA